jgi:hypothetical protein
MVSVRVSMFVLLIFIILVILLAVNTLCDNEVDNFSNEDRITINNSSKNDMSMANASTMTEQLANENLMLPSREYILNNINWSNYSLLSNPYIHSHEVSDPTFVINHKFLYLVIVVEIKDATNKTEILNQISGVVLEERKMLGPNSGPSVWGTVDGMWVYYGAMIPYESHITARYLP